MVKFCSNCGTQIQDNINFVEHAEKKLNQLKKDLKLRK